MEKKTFFIFYSKKNEIQLIFKSIKIIIIHPRTKILNQHQGFLIVRVVIEKKIKYASNFK